MSVLLETTVGDVVIDLDLTGSPNLCRNFLKLCQARYYTNTLIYNVQANRFCQAGDPCGDGSGGASIYGVMDMEANVKQSTKRFIPSHGRLLSTAECRERGRVVMTEMNGVPDTIGSQFLITLAQGEGSGLDGYNPIGGTDRAPGYLSLGQVAEDDGAVLDAIHAAYCDANGRPYADIRIVGAWVLHDPFPDPDGMDALLQRRGCAGASEPAAPHCERPPEELVERRIGAEQIDAREEETPQQRREREEEQLRKEAKSRAVVLEMLGDLPDAEITAPENVLFVCKLNPITQDDDLELIFSRFDSQCKADIIRDPDSGKSLCYAFVEFHDKQQCVEAYFKMNNALVDDRRIKVDFSQSVAKVWGTFHQQGKAGGPKNMPRLDSADGSGGNGRNQRRGDRGGVEHRGGRGFDNRPPQRDLDDRRRRGPPSSHPEQFHHDRQDRPQHANRTDHHRDTRHNNNNDDDISSRDGDPVRRDRAERRDRIDSSDDSRERKRHRKKEHKKRNKEDGRYDDERKRDGDDDRKRRRDGDDRKERSSSGRRRHDDQDEEKRHRKKDRGAEDDDDDDRRRRRKHHRHSDNQERHRKHGKKDRKRSRSGDRGDS